MAHHFPYYFPRFCLVRYVTFKLATPQFLSLNVLFTSSWSPKWIFATALVIFLVTNVSPVVQWQSFSLSLDNYMCLKLFCTTKILPQFNDCKWKHVQFIEKKNVEMVHNIFPKFAWKSKLVWNSLQQLQSTSWLYANEYYSQFNCIFQLRFFLNLTEKFLKETKTNYFI